MKKIALVFGALCLSVLAISCAQIPIATEKPVNNETYDVDYLFEHDGCKVYRFRDQGNYVYFTNCKGDVTSFRSDSTKTRVVNSIRK